VPIWRRNQAAQKRLKQVQPDRKDERRAILVSVEVEREVEFELEVVYAVRNASWQPLYDVRLLEDEVTVTYLATISQKSGEDWPEVELSLSTARPAVSATLPELRPWYIAPPPPPQPMMPVAAVPGSRGAP
jgi:uncharacterized protein (TIGR02231 family)